MTPLELKREIEKRLRLCGCQDPASDAAAIVCDALGIRPGEMAVSGPVSEEAQDRALSWAEERAAGRPVQYITGKAPFMDFEFLIREGTLIPRADTERLVERALEVMKGKKAPRVADLCSGSGCIGLSIAKYRPDAQVHLFEIDEGSAALSRENVRRLGLQNAQVTVCDVMSLKIEEESVDVIVSNPPYIPSEDIDTLSPEVRLFEPRRALDGGPDGLAFYRQLTTLSCRWLKRGGRVLFEVGAGQADEVSDLLHRAGLSNITVIKDYGGVERVVEGSK